MIPTGIWALKSHIVTSGILFYSCFNHISNSNILRKTTVPSQVITDEIVHNRKSGDRTDQGRVAMCNSCDFFGVCSWESCWKMRLGNPTVSGEAGLVERCYESTPGLLWFHGLIVSIRKEKHIERADCVQMEDNNVVGAVRAWTSDAIIFPAMDMHSENILFLTTTYATSPLFNCFQISQH